ncbi:phosphoribosylamine--glycine ligase [Candidatus Woesearchaeota archaeon]|nr:phosphoribosylamine--glycine ligase [Candidatus Woesearchaeota archaeon]
MEPKKFLFVSKDALISDTAWQISKEGNDVKYFIESISEHDIGDGFVDKIDNWEKEVDWADVIVFDDVLGQGAIAQKLREQGKKVIGGSAYTDKLEDDRSFGQEELKRHGIAIIPYAEFTSFDEAINYVKNNPAKYVIKPSGEAQNKKGLLFVGEEDDGADVIRVLESYKKTRSNYITVVQLQRRITGVEVAVGAFFNGNEFLYPVNINFEHKKLFPGNLGPSTGEMGTSMFWSMPNRLFSSTLKKLEETLRKEGYNGYIDLNCIVNGNGIYPLEFTARFGYPTISIQQEGLNMPIGEFFYRMANGEKFEIKTKKGFQVGIRIVVPPFPFYDEETFESHSKGSTIVFKKPDYNGVHIEDVKMINGEWVVTGRTGIILIVCGAGQSMREAKKQAYNRIHNILIPHMFYRTDISDRWYEDSDKLHNWGYLREG